MSASPISDFAQAASPAASYVSSAEARNAPSDGARLARQTAPQDGRPSKCDDTPPLPSPSTDARAARLEKFKSEQAIVEYLNRGVSVGEIAARLGFDEEPMRAVVRDILARR